MGDDKMAIPVGLLGWQRVIILPLDDQYYCIYNNIDYCKSKLFPYRLLYSKFTKSDESATGKVLEKEKLILKDSLMDCIYAVRHGNGRDWWLVTFDITQTEILIFLVNKNGISLTNRQPTFVVNRSYGGIGQICLSPDGAYMAWYHLYTFEKDGAGFTFAEFDRCDGTIHNIKTRILTTPILGAGVAFSSDSKYLYACNGVSILQYDMEASDPIGSEYVAAEYDGYKYYFANDTIQPNPIGHSVNFCLMKLGPDGKIYVFPGSIQNRLISVINSPTEKGTSSDVRQHSLLMNTVFIRTVPNMPEFRLGPLDGSACDTLGIDNHPIAKYRYEPDTIDHLRIRFTDLSYFRPETWSWDFGDNTPKVSMRHPYHTYTKNGTYNVCLTVSNENSVNTVCRTITIGTSSSEDAEPSTKPDITLFPNPVEDMLLITIGEYIPEHGQVTVYDITGQQVIRQRAYYGHNNVDMTQLPAGTYIVRFVDLGSAQHSLQG
ncbi:MAG: T9SS type A sorting domain-containing protein [Saprospiraceae bacterium]|nr:T9SS type A sorting domain-containing protein [Saprospiraceae bacterium]